MSVTLLRWKGGSGGDTVLKLLLLSNPEILSQTKYVNHPDKQKSHVDKNYCQTFEYDQISKIAMFDYRDVDPILLQQQLDELERKNKTDWILKSHYYNTTTTQRTIDIVVPLKLLPFVVTANLVKNSRQSGLMSDYHVLTHKITDPEILHRFDLFNGAKNLIEDKNLSEEQLVLTDILEGWDIFEQALHRLGLKVSNKYQSIYETWLDHNRQFIPGSLYQLLVSNSNFDYTNTELTVAEQYCLLALSGDKFKILEKLP